MPGRRSPSRALTAQYDGECAGCGSDIAADVDEIVMWHGEPFHNDEGCCEGLKESGESEPNRIRDRWADD